VQLLDRAGRKHLIHPNAAARQKSRLAKLKAKLKTG
jgi:ribosomal protein S20